VHSAVFAPAFTFSLCESEAPANRRCAQPRSLPAILKKLLTSMNKNFEVLSNPIFDLPVERGNEEFIVFLDNKFNEYYKTLNDFEGELGLFIRNNRDVIKNQICSIHTALVLYYDGRQAEAYNYLDKGYKEVLGYLWIQNKEFTDDNSNRYFRIRTGENVTYKKQDLFHIPFDKRNLVERQRFSLSGVPCLYLGKSIYTCWEELNRPINNVHISRFDLKDLRLLLLNRRPELIRAMLSRPFEDCNDIIKRYIINFIMSFPLVLSCSIKVEDYTKDFVPEYIIPQLLLQSVKASDEIDGILYISNKASLFIEPTTIDEASNVVIPTKEIKKYQGICSELKKVIKITKPILIDFDNSTSNFIDFMCKNTDYSKTEFGVIEQKLIQMKADYID
jgi:hypothetical protein